MDAKEKRLAAQTIRDWGRITIGGKQLTTDAVEAAANALEREAAAEESAKPKPPTLAQMIECVREGVERNGRYGDRDEARLATVAVLERLEKLLEMDKRYMMNVNELRDRLGLPRMNTTTDRDDNLPRGMLYTLLAEALLLGIGVWGYCCF